MTGKILVSDDTAVNRKVLATILQRVGHQVLLAEDGPATLRCVRAERPDLVLLDIMMPGIDGYAVCAELKADPATAETVVVFLTALGATADKIRGLEVGAADYITKPFDGGEVLARVQNQLRLLDLTRSLQAANRALREKQRLLDEDLEAAADIQLALIPPPGLQLPGVGLAWLFEPCSAIGGDTFNAQALGPDYLAFYIVDVNGHGVPPAMISVLVSQSLSPDRGLVRRAGDETEVVAPARLFEELEIEYPMSRFERYFTLAYLLLHRPTGRLLYSSAAHPPPLLLRRSGDLEWLDAGGSIVGLGLGGYDQGEVRLEVGDRVFLYTDGITECTSRDGQLFGGDRLATELGRSRCEPLAASCKALRDRLADFGPGQADDDISLLAFEYLGHDA